MVRSYEGKPTSSELVKEFGAQIKDKVLLVTGVSPGGLGAWFVEAIAPAGPKLIVLAGRNTGKAQATADKIKQVAPGVATRILQLDLESFASARKAAEEVNGYTENIDALVNNAGVMATPYKKTADRHESQFQANHLSHFLFTNLIIGKILASGPDAKIVNVSSDGYRLGAIRYYDYHFHDGESYDPWTAYGQSKTANILYTRELARRLGPKGLTAISIHPGAVFTNLPGHLGEDNFAELKRQDRFGGYSYGWEPFDILDQTTAVSVHIYATFSPETKSFNGQYIQSLKTIPQPVEETYPWALGEVESRKLWRLSEKLVGQKFDF